MITTTPGKLIAFCVLALCALSFPPRDSLAQQTAIDPVALEKLRAMTDYLGSLQSFSVHTHNTLEELLDSGNRVDVDVSADIIVSRPDKLQATRSGDLVDQHFFYDGATLTLFNPTDQVYATEPAPPTIEEMLDLARESLGLDIPAADLIYGNAYELLTRELDLAMVVGASVIGGIRCDHLLFSRPGVDFQLWIGAEGTPLPYKYVVTDTGFYNHLSIGTVMSEWNTAPQTDNTLFRFEPPEATRRINFMPL